MLRSPARAFSIFAALVLASTSLFAAHQPMLSKGPQAQPADAVGTNVAGANFRLFTCQVGLSPVTCYDPFQMRHAYGVDSLINAGFDGHGKTTPRHGHVIAH